MVAGKEMTATIVMLPAETLRTISWLSGTSRCSDERKLFALNEETSPPAWKVRVRTGRTRAPGLIGGGG